MRHDLEGYFESFASQGFQNNPFFRSGTKKWGLAPPKRVLTFQVVYENHWLLAVEGEQSLLSFVTEDIALRKMPVVLMSTE